MLKWKAIGMHEYPANYLLSGQMVGFFTIFICVCIRLEKFFYNLYLAGDIFNICIFNICIQPAKC